MINRIWKWLAAAGGMLVAGLWVLLQLRTSQRDKARTEAKRQEKNAVITDKAREKQSDISEAANTARHENEQARQERHETPVDERRTGRFGTADRLRDEN